MSLRSLSSWYWFLLRWYVGAQSVYEWAMRAVCLLAGHHWEQLMEYHGPAWDWRPGEHSVCLRCGKIERRTT